MSNIPNCLQVFSLQFCPKSGNSIFDPKPKRLLKWLCCFGVIVTIYTLHCVTSGLYVISTFVSDIAIFLNYWDKLALIPTQCSIGLYIAEKYIYPDTCSNQFRDAPRIFVFDDAIFYNQFYFLWNTIANKTIA